MRFNFFSKYIIASGWYIVISLLLPLLAAAQTLSTTPTSTDTMQHRAKKSTINVPPSQTVRGIVIVPPHTLYKQKAYIQVGSDEIIELYSAKGTFPKMSFGSSVEATGILSSDYDPSRLKIVSKANIQTLASGAMPSSTQMSVSEISPDNAFSLIQVEGQITHYAQKSLLMAQGDAQVAIRLMQSGKLFPKSMAKGSRIRVSGFLKYEANDPVLYAPDLKHIAVLAKAPAAVGASTLPTTTPPERVIQGVVSSTPTGAQWYVVAAIPILLILGFAVKKYVGPRLG